MDKSVLWSLRLGYSAKQADDIRKLGIKTFLEQSFEAVPMEEMPTFIKNTPKTRAEKKAQSDAAKAEGDDCFKEYQLLQKKNLQDFKVWWIEQMATSNRPLREKMTVFWHNHFVVSSKKVNMLYWLFEHNNLLREEAFGNFRELTKKAIRTNAMLFYLDNTNNKKGNINENLSRELLELFTLGVGNYSEDDIKNGAKALAGLNIGENGGQYLLKQQDNDPIVYFGKTGLYRLDALVDVIFEQPEVPYLLTRKILQWFITDLPDEKLVRQYGDYFRQQDFEIKPLLLKIFTEEALKEPTGTKIKDPLLFLMQLAEALDLKNVTPEMINTFARQQGLDLYAQYNVKGWAGGRDWLTVQTYRQRINVSGGLCNGRLPDGFKDPNVKKIIPKWNPEMNNLEIIADFKQRFLVVSNPELQEDLEKILPPNFNSDPENTISSISKLFEFIIQSPEFQLM